MKLILGLVALLFIILVGTKFAQDYLKTGSFTFFEKTATVTVKGQTFKAYVAKTPEEQAIGLSEKKSLPQDYGMVFLFPKADYYSFWMKNMKISIDIIYINGNKVVTVYENVPPAQSKDDIPQVYKPEEPSNAVLEINAGLAKKYNIKKGDQVTIKE